jgi:hypothetical protein
MDCSETSLRRSFGGCPARLVPLRRLSWLLNAPTGLDEPAVFAACSLSILGTGLFRPLVA